jgi:XTP/dITP diphosphohydrolase
MRVINSQKKAVILIASSNRGKLAEMNEIFKDFGGAPGSTGVPDFAGVKIELLIPDDLHLSLDVPEDGETYAENAARKALAYSRAAGMVALADDSGLEVEVLGGRPGLHSARYAPQPNATDADRRAVLLAELKAYPHPWKARFRCTVAIALPDGSLFYSEGECPGEITPDERGTSGFGYDPVFQVDHPSAGCATMAELGMEIKNKISHRARAVRAAFPVLYEIFFAE